MLYLSYISDREQCKIEENIISDLNEAGNKWELGKSRTTEAYRLQYAKYKACKCIQA